MSKYRTVLIDDDPDKKRFILKFYIPYSAISVTTYEMAKVWTLGLCSWDLDEFINVIRDILRDEIKYRNCPNYELDID